MRYTEIPRITVKLKDDPVVYIVDMIALTGFADFTVKLCDHEWRPMLEEIIDLTNEEADAIEYMEVEA